MSGFQFFRQSLELVFTHWSCGRLKDAIYGFKSALDLKPHSAEILMNLGRIYLETGPSSIALEYFDQVFGLDPRQHEAFIEKGINVEPMACISLAFASGDGRLDTDTEFRISGFGG